MPYRSYSFSALLFISTIINAEGTQFSLDNRLAKTSFSRSIVIYRDNKLVRRAAVAATSISRDSRDETEVVAYRLPQKAATRGGSSKK